ncbi:MAG: redoxin domain-containing protein [Pyrobaculum sp.]
MEVFVDSLQKWIAAMVIGLCTLVHGSQASDASFLYELAPEKIRGHGVYMLFIPECPACRAQLADMMQLTNHFQAPFGLITRQDSRLLNDVLDEHGFQGHITLDPSGSVIRHFGLYLVPSWVFVNYDGQVVGLYDSILTVDELLTLMRLFEQQEVLPTLAELRN